MSHIVRFGLAFVCGVGYDHYMNATEWQTGYNNYPEAPDHDAHDAQWEGFWDRHNDLSIEIDEAEYLDDLEYEGYQMSDVEADADTLASAGWGTEEDYGYYGDEF